MQAPKNASSLLGTHAFYQPGRTAAKQNLLQLWPVLHGHLKGKGYG